MEHVETIVIGAGQAGLAMSHYLRGLGREHLVLERARVAERWRTQRWDSLRFQFPNWSMELPGQAYCGGDPDGFAHRDEVSRFIEDYAVRIRAPLRTGIDVLGLRPAARSGRYLLHTEDGDLEACNVVIATGPYQRPRIPRLTANLPQDLLQLHAGDYRNPSALPPGAVLVVGSGASGCQIADELLEAGRRVYLSVGRHHRLPRRYRGRDVFSWMVALGRFDACVEDSPEFLSWPPILVTGVHGGYDLDLRRSAANGMVLLGHLAGARGARLTLAPDLAANLDAADQAFEEFVRTVDEYVDLGGIDAPAPPDGSMRFRIARSAGAPREIDLREAGIGSVIWATGYALDFSWVELPIFTTAGEPIHQRGVTSAPGVYFLGLRGQHTLKSSALFGVGEDAAHIAERIVGSRPSETDSRG